MCKSGEGAYLSRVPFLRAGLPRPPFRRFQWVPGGPSLDGRAKKTCLNRGTNPPCALESINRFWTSSGHESALRSNQRSVAGGILVSRGQQRSPAKISCRKQGASCRDGALLCANFFQEQSQEVQWNQQIDLKMGQNKANFGGRMLWNHVTSPIGLQAGRVS